MCSWGNWETLHFCHYSQVKFTIPFLYQGHLGIPLPQLLLRGQWSWAAMKNSSVHIHECFKWLCSGKERPQPSPRSQMPGTGWRLAPVGPLHLAKYGLLGSWVPLPLFWTSGEAWCLLWGRQVPGKWAGWPTHTVSPTPSSQSFI